MTALLISYVLGSFPTSIVIGKLVFGRDPRLEGSGNAGGTNTFRLFGWKAGLAVSLIDVAKGSAAAAFVSMLIDPVLVAREGAMLLCGTAAVIGHVWTVFAGFRGGKGVATAAGAVLVFAPGGFAIALASFALVLMSTGLVSLSSLAAALGLGLALVLPAFSQGEQSPWLLGFGLFALPFIAFTHRANIARLFRGQVKRFEKVALLRRLWSGRGASRTH